MNVKKQHSAGIILYKMHEGERLYLLLHYISGHWDFAKGKIEPGETKHEAALRELEEETSLHATLLEGFEDSFAYTFKDRAGNVIHKTVFFFIGHTDNSAVKLSREHKNYSWLSYEHALARLTYDNARQVLMNAHRYLMEHNQ
ncbi:MAG: NUDIX domain-containing protein [Candidatus Dependentiae bacterium]